MDVEGDPVPDGWIFHSAVDVRRKNHAVWAFVVCAMRVTGTGRRGGTGSGGARSAHAPAPRAPTHAAGPRGRCSLPRHPRSRSVGGRGHAAAHTADMTAPHHTTPPPRGRPRQIQRANDSWPDADAAPTQTQTSLRGVLSVLFDTVFFKSKSARGPFFLLLLEELAVVVE